MNVLVNPGAVLLLVTVAAWLMASAGGVKKRLRFGTPQCQVCRRPRDRCTCRWR